MFDESCIFCKIVYKQAPSSIIYEDEAVMVFLDIRPLNMGHTLVIPKDHYVDIFDIPQTLLSQVHKIAQQVSSPIKKPQPPTESASSNRTAKLQDKTYSTYMCMLFQGLKGKNCRLFTNLKKLKEQNSMRWQRK